jgi:small subunit ribosomal protein S13
MFLFRNTLLEEDLNICASLKRIPGMSWKRAKVILSKSGITFYCTLNSLNEFLFGLIFILLKLTVISKVRIDRMIKVNINKLIDRDTYRGMRHKLNLPTRGQRTRTNAKTQKAKRIKI